MFPRMGTHSLPSKKAGPARSDREGVLAVPQPHAIVYKDTRTWKSAVALINALQ